MGTYHDHHTIRYEGTRDTKAPGGQSEDAGAIKIGTSKFRARFNDPCQI